MKFNHTHDHSVWESLFVLMLYGLFALLAFTMVAVGAGVYSDIRDTGNSNYDIRTSLSFAATQVRQMDTSGNVSIQQLEGKNALVIEDTIDGTKYETWLYHYDGVLYQLFMEKGIQFTPISGEKVMDIEEFNISQYSENSVLFEAENSAGQKGQIAVALRSGKGGKALYGQE